MSLTNSRRTAALYVLLAVAAATRLWMQAAAMPPYAGLDEIYHVGRLAFVLEEGRSPSMTEASLPPYVNRSVAGDPRALPAFGVIGAEWPKVARSRALLQPDSPLQVADLRPYSGANYEAQQPNIYYRLAAPRAKWFGSRTPLMELRVWRGFSVFCSIVIIIATAYVGHRFAGPAGVLAAVWLMSMPTWLTLVVRAGNDALACAFMAAGYALTVAASRRRVLWVAEAVVWALALATKLYSWPAAVVLPFFWHIQKAPYRRRALVLAFGAFAVFGTAFELASRTNNPLGLFAFDRPAAPAAAGTTPIDYGSVVRIIIATGAWTSAQHWNALRPLAIALYLGPILVLTGYSLWSSRHARKHSFWMAAIAIGAFALAQAVNLAGYIHQAKMQNSPLPAGGKEGWYWYSIAPLLIGTLGALVCRYAPRLIVIFQTAWLVGWDVLIHEGALFQDFAGATSPEAGDALFRWGPRAWPFAGPSLELAGVGPGAGWVTAMRLFEVVVVALLLVLVLRNRATDREQFELAPMPRE